MRDRLGSGPLVRLTVAQAVTSPALAEQARGERESNLRDAPMRWEVAARVPTSKSRKGRGRVRRDRVERPDMQARREAAYIVERALRGDGRSVSSGPLVLFSTATGDAWMLDPADGLARCLARDGSRLPDWDHRDSRPIRGRLGRRARVCGGRTFEAPQPFEGPSARVGRIQVNQNIG